jgi:hypothetical protein
MTLTLTSGGSTTLSVTDGCPGWDGDDFTVRPSLHIKRVNSWPFGGMVSRSSQRFRSNPQIIVRLVPFVISHYLLGPTWVHVRIAFVQVVR